MNVAVVGASNKPERYSYKAIERLKANGHTVFPVHPKLTEVQGIRVYSSLDQILEKFALKGMDPEIGSHFGVIEMDRPPTKDEIIKQNQQREDHIQKKIQECKEVCRKAGFPFPD